MVHIQALPDAYGAVSPPLYQTATFVNAPGSGGVFDYTRSGNPTRLALERTFAQLEGGASPADNIAFAFTSGLGALSAVLRATTRAGDVVAAHTDLYGGTHRLLTHASGRGEVQTVFCDLKVDPLGTLPENVRLIMVESPTNPLFDVIDLRRLCAVAKARGALVCVDNSMLSPVLMRPLELGADLVVHSATKFISGHSDIMAGLVTTANPELARRLAFVQNAEGNGLSPHDCWLLLRGLKTLPLRIQQCQDNASIVAAYLRHHPAVSHVYYLDPEQDRTCRASAIHFRQAAGSGSVLSFVPRSAYPEFSRRFLSHMQLFATAVSFGSVHSSAEIPSLQSHAAIPADQHTFPASLVRLSLGIEHVNDLLYDISQALSLATQETRSFPLQSHKLGLPLPPTDLKHACGASLPAWDDIIGYEMGRPEVHQALEAGYPRFVYPKSVRRLMELCTSRFASAGLLAMPTPSAAVACRLRNFLAHHVVTLEQLQAIGTHMVGYGGLHAVTFPATLAPLAKSFWQHTGELVSSRLAERACDELNFLEQLAVAPTTMPVSTSEEGTLRLLKAHNAQLPTRYLVTRLAKLNSVPEDNVFLFQSGMAAISGAARLLQTSLQDRPWLGPEVAANKVSQRFVVFGFPYLDTLKLLQRPELGPGVHFVQASDFTELERVLSDQHGALGIFVEYPSNPLLQTPDLRRVRQLADQYNVPLVVDDTIGNFANVNVLQPGGADLQVSSLTKIFSGSGTVMGGSLVVNPHSTRFSGLLTTHMTAIHENNLHATDAQILLGNSADLLERNTLINTSAEILADYLQAHTAVAHVNYPKFTTPELYQRFQRPGTGWGGLMSIVLRDKASARSLYDALAVPKGPGFGTNFSLVCPYTLLAHWNELQFAADAGVDPSLIRVWVGLEPIDQLLQAFEAAFEVAGSTAQHHDLFSEVPRVSH